jgi:hypothetical protein
MPFDPVLDGASHEHLLLLGQAVGPDAPVEGRPRGRSECRREVLAIAVDTADVNVHDVVPVAAGLDSLGIPQVIRTAGLKYRQMTNDS